MAYQEKTANRIREILTDKGAAFSEKKMFSGICFMVDDKMLCGTHIDNKSGEELLLCRVGEDYYAEALEQNYCIPMEFTGRPMKGYVFVTEGGVKTKKEISSWIQRCLDFNPLAKRSKKK